MGAYQKRSFMIAQLLNSAALLFASGPMISSVY
jgi:hypothetical protein